MNETPLILIVDDEPLLLHATEHALTQAGYRTSLANDGLSALQMAREQKPELTLLDVNLPDMNGVEVCHQIKTDPDMTGCFVMMLSSERIDAQSQVDGLDGGADGYIARPVTNAELLARVRGLLRIQQAEEALREAHDLLEQRVAARTAELNAANIELVKASRLKDEFLSNISHELRTPLTGILGLSEVLLMPHVGPLNEKQSTYLSQIHSGGKHLLALINDILDYSKLEAGKVELSLWPCSLEEICQASLHAVSAQAAAKNLRSSLVITPQPLLIKTDARRLKQILVNLLGNAVKFTPEGGSFGIEATGSEAEGVVRITVWDTGIGISAENLPRLFQPFAQLDARLTREFPGTGLGLALVRKLTELHKGTVSVQSVVGQGSRFTVILPGEALNE